MDTVLMWIFAAMGFTALIGAFVKMQKGFGPFNLRIIGLVLVGTFAALLGLRNSESLTAAMGILGAIVGYLFGLKDANA